MMGVRRKVLGAFWLHGLGAILLASVGCRRTSAGSSADGGEAGAAPGLSAEQAAQVLAKVGDRVITLGEYAEALAGMDPIDRLRYQTPERRKELLEEMIDTELLAQDARSRGLDQQPESQQAIREILREALLAEVRKQVPLPVDVQEEEVRGYYDAHRDEFRDPERRRVAHIVVSNEALARKILGLLQQNPQSWGELYAKYSLDVPKNGERALPAELAGDLGIVSAPQEGRAQDSPVPPEVRAAAFGIASVGQIASEPVATKDAFHVVKLTSKSDARERKYAEAERIIRLTIVQKAVEAKEKELDAQLRAQFPVQIDEQALARVRVPKSNEFDPDAAP